MNHYQRWWWATTQKSNNARVCFFFLFSKCIICNFFRQRNENLTLCVHSRCTDRRCEARPTHTFLLYLPDLARWDFTLFPETEVNLKEHCFISVEHSKDTELPSSDLKRVSSIVILLFTCVVLSSLLCLLSILFSKSVIIESFQAICVQSDALKGLKWSCVSMTWEWEQPFKVCVNGVTETESPYFRSHYLGRQTILEQPRVGK